MADILKDDTDAAQSWVFGNWTTIGRPAGLRTGTTDDSEMRGITSAMGPGVLWRDHMKGVVGGLPPVWYEPPASVVNATVCVNPSIMGGNGSGLLPSAACPPSFRRSEIFVKGTEPRIDDRDMWIGGCYRLVAHFPVRQPFADRWAANAGAFSGGRFGGVRGTGAPPTPAPTKKP